MPLSLRSAALIVTIFSATLCGLSSAQGVAAAAKQPAPFDVRAHYTKTEYHVKMRDGVSLFTSVYAPKDTSRKYPILMTRTCYSVAPYGPDTYRPLVGPSREFAESGYIFVYQDVRGRYQSEGTFAKAPVLIDHPTGTMHDESTDAYDTVEWLLKNMANNNGRVGVYGISMPGLYTSAAIINGHPAIKAASPQAAVTDYHDNDDYYHNGALMLGSRNFFGAFRPQQNPVLPTPPKPLPYTRAEAYTAYLTQMEPLSKAKAFIDNPYFDESVDHPNYDDYYEARDISRRLHNITADVLVVGGWFDAEDISGPHKTFHAIEKQSPTAHNSIVIGPWVHGGWSAMDGERIGEVQFGSNTGDYFRANIQFPFFEQHLKDAPDAKLAKATMFETGSNVWRSYSAWPPAGSKPRRMYFQAGGKLSFDPPSAADKSHPYDEYVSDPAHPVPEVSFAVAPGITRDYMVADQRFASTRPDVLVYQTEVLAEDITFAGPLRAKLHVSTSGTDSDFDVKVIDVYPNDFSWTPPATASTPARVADVPPTPSLIGGYQQLVRGQPMRGKFRKSFRTPQPFTPGKVEAIDFSLVDVNHTFRKGHRIMVQVQSSWFPLTDLNPQTFVDIPNAKATDFKSAVERVYHTAQQPSGIEFQALP
jgi:putative CocE/NonD family hydrolase